MPKRYKVMIPKIIHRAWLGDRPPSKQLKLLELAWKRHHPGWVIQNWTESNRPRLRNEALYQTSKSVAERSNILRYELLEQFGGMYVDPDIECLKPLDRLIEDEEFFAGLRWNGLICNALIGSVPRHKLLCDLISHLPERFLQLPEYINSSLRSGSHALTEIGVQHPDLKLYPPEIFFPYDCDEKWKAFSSYPGAYTVHRWLNTYSANTESQINLNDVPSETEVSVILFPGENVNAMRLEWTLEALCDQNYPFLEVLFPPETNRDKITVMQSMSKRLRCVYSHKKHNEPYALDEVLLFAKGKRMLFLSPNCVPDKNLLEIHSKKSQRYSIIRSNIRICSDRKVFPYMRGVPPDYASIRNAAESIIFSDANSKDAAEKRQTIFSPISMPRAIVDAFGGRYNFDNDSVNRLFDELKTKTRSHHMEHQGPSATILKTSNKNKEMFGRYWTPPKVSQSKVY